MCACVKTDTGKDGSLFPSTSSTSMQLPYYEGSVSWHVTLSPAPNAAILFSSCSTTAVSQHTGVITNHLGTNASSPTSESDSHALLDEKEDSYFSEIRNFIANSEMNQSSALTDKRYVTGGRAQLGLGQRCFTVWLKSWKPPGQMSSSPCKNKTSFVFSATELRSHKEPQSRARSIKGY